MPRGFTLVEVVLALAITMIVTGTLLSLAADSGGAFTAQIELADMQQRLRVAMMALDGDLSAAGDGVYPSASADLPSVLPAIAPYRPGDPAGTFRADTITVTRLVSGAVHTATYWLKADDSASSYQLMMFDGSHDVPVVDHVVALRFAYFGDPEPPRLRRPFSDPAGPWVTYGIAPSRTATAEFAAGENCLFVNDGAAGPVPRLPALGLAGGPLVELAGAQLSDGPWCPDAGAIARWDADLLRVRRVVASLRVEAANPAVRGPAGAAFAHAGTARGGAKWLPDIAATIDLVPRNAAAGR